jgi:uncharacterized protein (TIGR02058 family)
MNLRKFIVESGMGIDQHGQNATDAAIKAVKDAIARPCLTGVGQVLGLKDWSAVYVDVLVACPHPQQVSKEAIEAAMPVGNVKVEVIEGGMTARGVQSNRWGDQSDEMYIANAAVTVWVDVDQVRLPASQ